MGLAPNSALEGDVVAIIGGSSTPICLRRDNDGWMWIGAVYLHDAMVGELACQETELNCDDITLFDIH